MEKNQLVSIGMAAYNGEAHIKKAIESLLSQSYPYFELIISDDTSTDKTPSICRYFAQKDVRIRFIRQKKNLGFRNNFNFVLRQARGNYFMWASSDDFWHKDFIATLLSLLQRNPDAVLAVGNFDNVKNERHYHNKASSLGGEATHFSSLLNFIRGGDLSYYYGLHKTINLKQSGGYIASSRPFFKSSDYLTIFKVLLGGRMVFSKKVLYYKRDTGLFIDRFAVLSQLQFDSVAIKKIQRYLCFPLFFIYNLVTSIQYLVFSKFTAREKIILIFFALFHTSSQIYDL